MADQFGNEQAVDPSVLGFLSQLLQPSEAEAAQPAQDWRQQYLLRQQMAQQQAAFRAQLQAQAQERAAQLRSQEAQRKEQTKSAQQFTPEKLSQLMQQAPQAQQDQGPEMPITFGITPGTGTPYFTNRPEAPAFAQQRLFSPEQGNPEVSPEQLQGLRTQVTQQREAKQAQGQTQGANAADLARHAQIVQGLTKAGYSPTQAGQLADIAVPSVAQAEATRKQAEQANKPLTPETTSKLWKFNPATRDFDPVPPELTNLSGRELQAQGYRVYSDKQRAVVDELKDVDTAFQQLRSAVSGIAGINAMALKASELTGGNVGGPEGAIFKKATTNFTTIFDKFLGGVRGAGSPQMQAIRTKVLPSIISTGQVSDKLMGDLANLITTMGDARLKSVVGGQQFNAADVNKQAQKVLDTFTDTGIAVGRVPMFNPQGKPVTIPAEQVQEALGKGYKPYSR